MGFWPTGAASHPEREGPPRPDTHITPFGGYPGAAEALRTPRVRARPHYPRSPRHDVWRPAPSPECCASAPAPAITRSRRSRVRSCCVGSASTTTTAARAVGRRRRLRGICAGVRFVVACTGRSGPRRECSKRAAASPSGSCRAFGPRSLASWAGHARTAFAGLHVRDAAFLAGLFAGDAESCDPLSICICAPLLRSE